MPRHRAKPRSFHAGLIFPVGRVHRRFKKGLYAKRLSNGVPVYMTAVLEHVTGEILKKFGDTTLNEHLKPISPNHLRMTLRRNEDLAWLFKDTWIAGVCVLPNIDSESESDTADESDTGDESDTEDKSHTDK